MGRRSFSGDPAVVRHRRSDDIEAASFLALMARRYAMGRANRREVEDAIAEWRGTAPPAAGPAEEERRG